MNDYLPNVFSLNIIFQGIYKLVTIILHEGGGELSLWCDTEGKTEIHNMFNNKINDAINKDNPSKATINNRTKLLSKLLENKLKANLGLIGKGQESSIMRDTLIQTGILVNDVDIATINLEPPDSNIKYMLTQIKTFFLESNIANGQDFKALYDILTLHGNGIGLKKGVIPIYLATVIHHYKKMLVIKNKNNELKITAELLNNINEYPESYSVYLENWNEEKTEYMVRLENLFKDHIIETEKSFSGFDYIVLAMKRWYMSLPKYAKELSANYNGLESKEPYKPISKEQRKFINSLRNLEINAREYLFEKIFDIFDIGGFSLTMSERIKEIKQELDNAKNKLCQTLIEDIKHIFDSENRQNTSLSVVIKNWHGTLNENTLNYLFANNENDVLGLIKDVTDDEMAFIEQLAKIVTSLSLDDWNSDTIELFLNELKGIKETVENFNLNKAESISDDSDLYKIMFINKNGQKTTKTFSKTHYSNKAKLLLNEVTASLEEMGRAISRQEKRQVLMELVETMC